MMTKQLTVDEALELAEGLERVRSISEKPGDKLSRWGGEDGDALLVLAAEVKRLKEHSVRLSWIESPERMGT